MQLDDRDRQVRSGLVGLTDRVDALGGSIRVRSRVESTMRTGYEKGYDVITLSDGVAATSAEEHENAIKFNYPMFSEVMTAEAFTEELQGVAAH